jgi:hypothetical protein
MHTSIFAVVYRHDLLHVSANHVAIFKEIKSNGRIYKSVQNESTEIPEPIHIQGVSRLVGTTAGGDFLGLCDQKSSYKHVSDFGRLRSYGHF